ncbi:MAG: thioredoxin family protein [Vicinamibacterales bacterium]
MKRQVAAASLVGALLCGVLPTSAPAQLRRPEAELAPVAASHQIPVGGEARLSLEVALPDGFHVQSDAPRDPNLIPTVLTVEPPEGLSVGGIVFPKPIDISQAGSNEPLAVFEQRFVIDVRLTAGAAAKPGPVEVAARLRYQACNDKMCFAPATARTSWMLEVVPAGGKGGATPPKAAAAASGAAAVPVAAEPPGVVPRDLVSSGTAETARIAEPTMAATSIPVGTDAVAPGSPLAALQQFTIAGSTGGYLGSDDFLTFIRNAEAGVEEKGWFEGRGPLAIVLIVLLGGLALNLTPCVLPMIPINLAIIGAGSQAGSRARGFLLGGAYGLAMAVVYGILGLVVILTAGTFGTINASPWFNLGIAVLFVALGLAMFDVFLIDFSRYSNRLQSGAGRGTFVLSFSMGAVAALLAGACVAPVVIQVVLFSSNLYATGTTVALALPFLLGVGMAIPWPIAGAGLSALPKPGAWMVRVKQAFGVLILGTAVYYGYLAYELFANRWVDPASVSTSVEEQLKSGWYGSLEEGLAAAKREQKPVLVDLWATWCKNCLTMDQTTLQNPDVKGALDGYVKIKYQAEQPDEPPAQQVMQHVGAVGLPAYVILKP